MSLTGGTADNTEPAPAIWQVDEDQQVTLIANGVDTMNDQNSLTWNWNPSSNNNATWAESTVGANSEIEVFWTESGSHTINLQIVDDDGLTSDMILGYVMVNNVPPTSEPFTAQFPVGEDRLFELTGLFSDTPSDVDSLQVCWDIDLGNDADDNLVNNDDCDYIGDTISHSWPEAGVYTIRFHVTDDDGDVAESLVDVNVVNLRPKAALEAEKTTVVVGEEVVIWTTETSDTTSDLSLLMFSWDLDTDTDSNGDGDPANAMDTFTPRTSPLRHTFDTPGEKHIRLTVTDEDQSSTKDITIYVIEEKSGFLGMMGETAGFSNLLIVLIIVVGAIVAVGVTMAKKVGEDEIGLFVADSSSENSADTDFAESEEE
jgi:PKD repeat protein